MKKILIATTALVATAGYAAADINLSGAAVAGFKYVDNDLVDEKLTAHVDYTLTIAMSGETDGGLTFGADLTVYGDESSTLNGGDLVAYIEGGFGKFSAGNVGSAVDATLGLGDLGFDGLSTDNVAEALIDYNDQGTLMYKGTFGDFAVAASYNMSVDGTDPNAADAANEFSIAATYNMGDYDFGLGYDERGDVVTVKAGANVSGFDIDALASFGDNDATAYGLTASYTMGATTVTAAYSKAEDAAFTGDDGEAFGIGVAYDLGGGAKIKGGIAEVADVTVADLGITMSF
ncbi:MULTISPECIES: porin [unclassified Aliiroseovarius]|uniref:porin n=1 Tax=unclassified Aliiroseovarius TaxID=2623558 RepID=UPI00156A2767|nr:MULTISPECIES: porin [unclassified Aliiroseovarius]NRP32012.1 Porin [Aliiroseovarius sp. xm-m-314]NRP51342.1 Porin [Aliiroseovarius sp. xm-m-354]NRP81654.1 Porin [Aliiroseovarius sp. xm-v-209]NRQ06092.1 Porin [Aliiroseovarius sp. xm-m-309]NRQ09296.1 Porin [Aliiroseovarius sp. xm-v-201]